MYLMDVLNNFSDEVLEIDISNKDIIGHLDFSRFTKLKQINCGYNKIISLDNLPNSLIELNWIVDIIILFHWIICLLF